VIGDDHDTIRFLGRLLRIERFHVRGQESVGAETGSPGPGVRIPVVVRCTSTPLVRSLFPQHRGGTDGATC
jgi:hypothetical protein